MSVVFFGVCVACDVDCLVLHVLPPTLYALKPGQVQGGPDDIHQSYNTKLSPLPTPGQLPRLIR